MIDPKEMQAFAADLRAGKTDSQLRRKYHISEGTVVYRRNKLGIPCNQSQLHRKLTEEEQLLLERMYADGATDSELADAVNRSKTYARRWRRKMGYPSLNTMAERHRRAHNPKPSQGAL